MTTWNDRPPEDRAPAPAGDGDEYSATVLASHWIQRPEATVAEPTPGTVRLPTPPDRTEGTVLRFGPGVTAAAAHRTHVTLPAVAPPPAPPRHRRLRRHALPALVLIAVLAFIAWHRLGPAMTVRSVAVTAGPAALGCDATADVVGVVTTDGRPGTLTYRWIRSDGTESGALTETLTRGQKQARLHLLWTFQGNGSHTARAELRVLTPARATASATITYDCT